MWCYFHILDENTKGIPDFWLTTFKNVDMLADMVQDHDEPILQHLHDIKVKLSPGTDMVSHLSNQEEVFLVMQVEPRHHFW